MNKGTCAINCARGINEPDHGALYSQCSKEGNYTLIAGAHRLRAAKILGYSEIDDIVVETGKESSALLEVAENLFCNELSVIDRVFFVQT